MTTKYRKPLLDESLPYGAKILELINQICEERKFELLEINMDRDHIHFLIDLPPRVSPSVLVKTVKQVTTHTLWSLYEDDLKKEFWKTRLFWSPSYFISTIGQAEESVVKRYIENQGMNWKPIHSRT